MQYEEIVQKVKDIIVDKLGVEESEVTETAPEIPGYVLNDDETKTITLKDGENSDFVSV